MEMGGGTYVIAESASSREAAKYFALLELPGVGPVAADRLIEEHGTVEQALEMVVEGNAGAIESGVSVSQLVERLEEALVEASDSGIQIVSTSDPDYPKNLLRSKYARRYLFYLGHSATDTSKSVAVIGTSSPGPQSEAHVKQLVQDIASSGYTVVSGLARGVDGSAHRATLSLESPTVAVVGTGLHHIYPPEHVDMFNAISSRYAVYSHFLPHFRGARWSFPERNKVMAGMSLATIVMESRTGSGSLLQAASSLADSRPVFIHSSNEANPDSSKWLPGLVRRGAVVFTSWLDIVNDLSPSEAETNFLPGLEP